jgi:hypothetical protein
MKTPKVDLELNIDKKSISSEEKTKMKCRISYEVDNNSDINKLTFDGPKLSDELNVLVLDVDLPISELYHQLKSQCRSLGLTRKLYLQFKVKIEFPISSSKIDISGPNKKQKSTINLI